MEQFGKTTGEIKMNDTSENTQPQRVECSATKDTAVRFFIIAAMLLGMGVWCYLDKDNYPKPEAWDLEHVNDAAGYVFNNLGPYVSIPVGLVLAVAAVVSLTKRLTADKEGIGYAGKTKVLWPDVTSLDASGLESAQILYLHYGQNKKLKLDAYKLQNFRQLVAFVEAMVSTAPKE